MALTAASAAETIPMMPVDIPRIPSNLSVAFDASLICWIAVFAALAPETIVAKPLAIAPNDPPATVANCANALERSSNVTFTFWTSGGMGLMPVAVRSMKSLLRPAIDRMEARSYRDPA